MKPLSLPSLSVVAALVVASSYPDALEAQQEAGEIDIEARRESVVNLEMHIEQREQRISDLGEDILRMDDRLEERIDKVLETVGRYKDSNQSRTRVAQLKAEVIVGLKKTVEYYKGRQREVHEKLRQDNPDIPRETLQSDFDRFEKRIEKRVDQILKLSNTFTDPKELNKYEKTSEGSWGWGWNSGPTYKISEDWKHNRIESRHTASAREGAIKGLQESIDYLSQSNDYLIEKLKEKNLSEAERELYQDDLARNSSLIEHREAQIEEFVSTPTPKTKSLDRNSAHGMEQLIHDSVGDMRQDFFAIFQKYSELNRERADIKVLHDNLQARIDWLAEYDAKQEQQQ